MTIASLVMSGIVGMFGLAIAFSQLRINRRLARLEDERHKATQIQERRAQASQVACWVTPQDEPRAVLHLSNGGSQPIFQVHILVRPFYQDYQPAAASQASDGHFLGSLGPETDISWDLEVRADQEEVFLVSGSLPVEVAFLDVSRRQWRRTAQGDLEELDEVLGGFC